MDYFVHEKALVDPEAQIGKDTRIWAFAHVQKGARIGERCNICDGSFVEGGAVLGNRVTVKHHVSIFDGVTLEDNVFVGSNIAFINDKYPRSDGNDEWTLEKTLVKKGAALGANAVIMGGVTIGSYAVIGAGSVVLKDVPDYGLVCGNPGKMIGFACQCGHKLDEAYACQCGKQYYLNKQGLHLHE